MPQYIAEEVTRREELDNIVEIIWAAMDGYDASHQIFFPVHGPTPADREAAVRASKDRTWEDHKGDHSSHWAYVRDEASKEIVGGCQWRIYTQNPFPNGTPHIEAVWWPEDEGRRFASEVVRQCYTPRTKWMNYPHVGLSLMCVLPHFQRRGVGRTLMKWGLTRIDDLGLESFIEATDTGKGLYAQHGYQAVQTVSVNMNRDNASDEWREMAENLMPIGYTAMWRPSGGKWKEGEPERTWAKRLDATQM